jgi:hypothetical protein
MNAGTCWGKNKIDPSGRGIEKPRKTTLTLTLEGILWTYSILYLRLTLETTSNLDISPLLYCLIIRLPILLQRDCSY